MSFVRRSLVFVTLVSLSGPAAAASCQVSRARVVQKFEACVTKWRVACFDDKASCNNENLSKCGGTLASKWAKLAKLDFGPCAGERWVDNGDGSVTDKLTDLVWEQKTDDGSVHDIDNRYTESTGTPYSGNGTVYSDSLRQLNAGAGFAGSNAWRLPSLAELTSLLERPHPCTDAPCFPPALAVHSDSVAYMTTTLTDSLGKNGLWTLYPVDATAAGNFQTSTLGAVAVHGGH